MLVCIFRCSHRLSSLSFCRSHFAIYGARVFDGEFVTEKRCQFLLNWLFIQNQEACELCATKKSIRYITCACVCCIFDWMRARTSAMNTTCKIIVTYHNSQIRNADNVFVCVYFLVRTAWIKWKYCQLTTCVQYVLHQLSSVHTLARTTDEYHMKWVSVRLPHIYIYILFKHSFCRDRKLSWNSTMND